MFFATAIARASRGCVSVCEPLTNNAKARRIARITNLRAILVADSPRMQTTRTGSAYAMLFVDHKAVETSKAAGLQTWPEGAIPQGGTPRRSGMGHQKSGISIFWGSPLMWVVSPVRTFSRTMEVSGPDILTRL